MSAYPLPAQPVDACKREPRPSAGIFGSGIKLSIEAPVEA